MSLEMGSETIAYLERLRYFSCMEIPLSRTSLLGCCLMTVIPPVVLLFATTKLPLIGPLFAPFGTGPVGTAAVLVSEAFVRAPSLEFMALPVLNYYRFNLKGDGLSFLPPVKVEDCGYSISFELAGG